MQFQEDDRLVEFNRGLVFLLYKTYTGYLDDKEFVQKRQFLKENIASFPLFMQPSIAVLNVDPKRNKD